jgi:hypothetical protein
MMQTDGDISGDYKWCGIDLVHLYKTCLINGLSPENGGTFEESATNSGVEFENVLSIDVVKGMVKGVEISNLKDSFMNLKELKIRKDVKFDTSDMIAAMFNGLSKIENISIDKAVRIRSNAFSGLTMLKSIEFKSVEYIEDGAFKGCSSLKTIIITSCLKLSGDSVFYGCSSLEELDLSSLTKVNENAANIFYGCTKLNKLYLPSKPPERFNENSFNSLTSLEIVLPNDKDYIAYDDSLLVPGDVKEDLKWNKVNLNRSHFSTFTTFVINNFEITRRTLLTTLTLFEDEISSLTLKEGLVEAGDLYDALHKVPRAFLMNTFIAKEGTLQKIKSDTFSICQSLTSITIEDNVDLETYAFRNIIKLTHLVMTKQINLPSNPFEGTDNLEVVSLPNLNEAPASMFEGKTNLTTATLTLTLILQTKTFRRCVKLQTLDMPNVYLMFGDQHFEDCSLLTLFKFRHLTIVPPDSVNIFKGCSGMTSIELGMFPPIQFHQNIFMVTDTDIPTLIVNDPSTSLKNYYSQSQIVEDKFVWKGIIVGDVPAEGCPEHDQETSPTSINDNPNENTGVNTNCDTNAVTNENNNADHKTSTNDGEDGHSTGALVSGVIVTAIAASAITTGIIMLLIKKGIINRESLRVSSKNEHSEINL